MRPIHLAFFLALLLGSFVPLTAQIAGTGSYPFSSLDSRGFDSINLGNLNTQFSIPVVNRPGRGMAFNYAIQYEGLVWRPVVSGATTTWTPDPSWGFQGMLNGTAFSGYLTHGQYYRSCPRPPHYSGGVPGTSDSRNYVYHDPYGINHLFNYSITGGCVLSNTDDVVNGNGSTNDSSGYLLVDGYHVQTRNGALITPASSATGADNSSITDANGNTISADASGTFIDTLGVKALSVSGTNPLSFTYPVALQSNGATTASTAITYHSYTVRTNFGCSGIVEYGSTAVNLVDRITLADGSFYAFTYEGTPGATDGAVTSRLQSITLPTGGTIIYAYSAGGCNGSSGMNADGTVGTLTRTTTDGTRSYTRTTINASTSITVQDEVGNQSVYYFSVAGGFFYETHRQIYQGQVGGTALLDRSTCYNGAAPPCDGAGMTLPIVSTIALSSYNGGSQSEADSTYNTSGLLTALIQKGGGTVLTSTANAYNTVAGLTQTTTRDASGNVISSSNYGYDEQAPTTTSGIPQHVATTGIRGNQTSASMWLSSTASLNTTTTYYDTGMPLATTTPNGQTHFSYDATQTFTTGTTLPTPSSGVSLSTAASYDAQSGAMTSVTGMNPGQTTQVTQYDPRLRPMAISAPDGGNTHIFYRDPVDFGVIKDQSAGQSTEEETQLDSYGRPSRIAVFNGQATNAWYQVDSCYNALGQLQFQSTSYQGPGFGTQKQCSGNGISYVYDALGRVTSSTTPDGTSSSQYVGRAVKSIDVNGIQKIMQYDQLGRISGVCELSSNANLPSSGVPTNCGMEISGTGFVTTYSYDLANHRTTVQQGVQTRLFQYDAASRLTGTLEPERGTTSYTYAYNGTGLLVTRARSAANQTNASVLTHTATQYDSLGRVVSVNYDDGLTPNKSYQYDASAGWANPNQTNLKGAMSLALSGTVGGGTTFSYGIMGQVLNLVECLPSGCGNSAYDHQQSVTYDYAGELTSQSDPVTGTISYGHSPAGEVTSIVNQTFADQYNPANLVSNVVNGPNGPVTFSYGNGLSQYDLYKWTGMLQGAWVCPHAPAYGCNSDEIYGYNALRTGSQVYLNADSFNPQNNFGYDEFNRLTSSNYQYQEKSSPAPGYDPNNYTYSPKTFNYVYDRYGNRSQQNAPQGGPAPSYNINASTNQITGLAYDAAGNLSSDGISASYQYDAEGNVIKVGGSYPAQYIYDALNHRVQVQSGGLTVEYLYDVAGRRTSTWYAGTITGIEGRIYWGNRLLAFRSNDGRTYFDHQDNTGTERVRTAYDGSIANTFPSTSLPYDDAYTSSAPGTASDLDNLHFAGMERDTPASRHAQFRQYASIQGRWMSPDPYDGSYDITNPQSLNRYTYVRNSPLSYVDPLGLSDCTAWEYAIGACTTDSITVTTDPPPDEPTETGSGENSSGSSGSSGGAKAPNNPLQPTACQVKTLNAINNQFGTNLMASNILPTSDPNPTAGGGQINTNFGVVSGLLPGQFNAIQSGRFAPSGVFGFITGYGSSLHVVAGPNGLDPSANLFGTSNIGGMYSAGFTAHFDSAFAYNPLGALLHYLIDVRGHGAHRQPCP